MGVGGHSTRLWRAKDVLTMTMTTLDFALRDAKRTTVGEGLAAVSPVRLNPRPQVGGSRCL